MAAAVVFAALIARELGGGAEAQGLTAATVAVSTQFIGSGHYLATSTLDPFLWTVLLWLLVRWVRTRADGLLVWAGVVTAFTLYTKFLIGGFWLVAGVVLLVSGPRELLRRPKLWLGAAIAAVALVPTLVWQATHGWPQLGMGAAVSNEVSGSWGGRLTFLPTALLVAGLPVGAVLLAYGLWRLLRSRELRFLGWTTVLLTLVFLLVNGRSYYVAGMYPVCWAVAAVELETPGTGALVAVGRDLAVYALAAVLVLTHSLPVWPQAWLNEHPSLPAPLFAYAEIGWPERRARWQARSRRCPTGRAPPWSPSPIGRRARWTTTAARSACRSRPARTAGTPPWSSPGLGPRDVLFVGTDPRPLLGHFADLRPVGQGGHRRGRAEPRRAGPADLAGERAAPAVARRSGPAWSTTQRCARRHRPARSPGPPPRRVRAVGPRTADGEQDGSRDHGRRSRAKPTGDVAEFARLPVALLRLGAGPRRSCSPRPAVTAISATSCTSSPRASTWPGATPISRRCCR